MPNGSALSAGSPSPREAASVQNSTPAAQMATSPAHVHRGGFIATVSWHGRPRSARGRRRTGGWDGKWHRSPRAVRLFVSYARVDDVIAGELSELLRA